MTDTRDHPPSLHLRASETVSSHLAHWPPRLRGHEHKPIPVKHHQTAELTQHAKPHGLELTRSAFSDDAGE